MQDAAPALKGGSAVGVSQLYIIAQIFCARTCADAQVRRCRGQGSRAQRKALE